MQCVPFDRRFDRESFSCGVVALDQYLKKQLSQDLDRDAAKGYLMVDGSQIVGYYTLSATAIQTADVPEIYAKKIPRYPVIPAVIIGRLALDERFKGNGLGGELLVDAFEKIVMSPIAAWAMIVNAKDKAAASFYQHYQFEPFTEAEPLKLFLPTKTARVLLQQAYA